MSAACMGSRRLAGCERAAQWCCLQPACCPSKHRSPRPAWRAGRGEPSESERQLNSSTHHGENNNNNNNKSSPLPVSDWMIQSSSSRMTGAVLFCTSAAYTEVACRGARIAAATTGMMHVACCCTAAASGGSGSHRQSVAACVRGPRDWAGPVTSGMPECPTHVLVPSCAQPITNSCMS